MYYPCFLSSSNQSFFNGTAIVPQNKCQIYGNRPHDKALPYGRTNISATLSEQESGVKSIVIPIRGNHNLPKLSVDLSLYQNTTVILTGATGFVGSTILCSLLEKTNADVILLVRGKDGTCPSNRISSLLQNAPVFKPIRSFHLESIQERIKVVSSDLDRPNLNVDQNAWEATTNWVSCKNRDVSFIHCTASMRFFDPLVDMFPINVLCITEIIRLLEKSSLKVKNFVYLSTAYVSSFKTGINIPVSESNGIIEKALIRKIGPSTAAEVMSLTESDLMEIEGRVCEYFPNNYTYTKLLAEIILEEWIGSFRTPNISLSVVRPTVICSAESYPYPGFVSSEDGFCAILAMYGRGLLRRFPFSEGIKLDIVPVDKVANTALLAGLIVHDSPEKYVMHIGSSAKDGVLLQKVFDIASTYFRQRYPFGGGKLKCEQSSVVGGVNALDEPLSPDELEENEKRFLKISDRVNKNYAKTYSFFVQNSWVFNDEKLNHMEKSVTERMITMFPVSMSSFKWNIDTYVRDFSGGLVDHLFDPSS